jgi:hypothetical protein
MKMKKIKKEKLHLSPLGNSPLHLNECKDCKFKEGTDSDRTKWVCNHVNAYNFDVMKSNLCIDERNYGDCGFFAENFTNQSEC